MKQTNEKLKRDVFELQQAREKINAAKKEQEVEMAALHKEQKEHQNEIKRH